LYNLTSLNNKDEFRPLFNIHITAIILTFNEEINVETCLQSINGWCQEIFIVDSGSTDCTLQICKKYTEQIYKHTFVNSASQWDWALKNLPIKTEWVLPLDADHIITERLQHQLIEAASNPEPSIDGYYATHRYFFLGKRIRGFKPYSLRLFRLGKTRLDRSEMVDFRFLVEGKTKNLTGEILEINKKELSIDFWIDKHQVFSSRMAVEEILRTQAQLNWSFKPNLLGNYDSRIIWLKNRWYHMPLYLRPFIYFIYRYFIRLAFLDGTTGFTYTFLQAFWFRYLIDLKIGKLRRQLDQGVVTLEQLQQEFSPNF